MQSVEERCDRRMTTSHTTVSHTQQATLCLTQLQPLFPLIHRPSGNQFCCSNSDCHQVARLKFQVVKSLDQKIAARLFSSSIFFCVASSILCRCSAALLFISSCCLGRHRSTWCSLDWKLLLVRFVCTEFVVHCL